MKGSMNSRFYDFLSECMNALHLTRVHCATIYQSAVRHEQHEDVTLSSCRPLSCGFQCDRLVVMFCPDLSERYDGRSA